MILPHLIGRQSPITIKGTHRYAINDTTDSLCDGSEELYDLQDDPNEFENRINDPKLNSIANDLREWIPDAVPPVAGSAHRVLERRDGKWFWEGEAIDREHPPMDIGSTPLSDLPK